MWKTSSKTYRLAGLSLIAMPITFLLLLMLFKLIGGDLGGLSHLIQAFPLIFILLTALKNPSAAGWLMIYMSGVAAMLFPLAFYGFTPQVILFFEMIFLSPAFLSGILLIQSDKKDLTQMYEKNVQKTA